MSIAWSNLSDLEIVQLLHLRPDLQEDYEEHMGYKVPDPNRDFPSPVMSETMGVAFSED